MDGGDKTAEEAWVENWRRVGPELERIRRQELRAFRYEENVEAIDSLLEIACRFAVPQPTSGLVEQQRLFGKLRQ